MDFMNECKFKLIMFKLKIKPFKSKNLIFIDRFAEEKYELLLHLKLIYQATQRELHWQFLTHFQVSKAGKVLKHQTIE